MEYLPLALIVVMFPLTFLVRKLPAREQFFLVLLLGGFLIVYTRLVTPEYSTSAFLVALIVTAATARRLRRRQSAP